MTPERISGNIFIRPNVGQAGDVVAGHKHTFDHTTVFFVGSFLVKREWPDGHVEEKRFVAPDSLLIPKDVVHTITHLGQPVEDLPPNVREAVDLMSRRSFLAGLSAVALAAVTVQREAFLEAQAQLPSIFWCVYSHRDPQARITQQYTGWDRSYT